MTDDALIDAVRKAVRDELRRHQAEIAAERLQPAERAVVEALGLVFGAGSLKTSIIVADCMLPVGDRPALRLALQTLVPDLNAHRVGIVLGNIARNGGQAGAWRLVASEATDRGGRVWVMEAVRRD